MTPSKTAEAYSCLGAAYSLGLVTLAQRPAVLEAEKAARIAWGRRGSSREERIASVKRELLGMNVGGLDAT